MAGRFANSQRLVRQAFGVLQQDRELVWFPVIGGFASLLFLSSFVVPFALTRASQEQMTSDPINILLLFIYYLGLSLIATFFNTALVACVLERLRGGHPTFTFGWNAALAKIGKIFTWAIIAATVGVVLRMIQGRSGILGKVIAGFAGLAWGWLTFFIVPVMLTESLSVPQAIKRSGELFKATWGENVIGNITMGLFFLPFFLVGVLLFGGGMALALATQAGLGLIITIILVMVVFFVVLGIVSSALNGIFVAALYHFANSHQPPPGFDTDLVQTAFRPKPGSAQPPSARS